MFTALPRVSTRATTITVSLVLILYVASCGPILGWLAKHLPPGFHVRLHDSERFYTPAWAKLLYAPVLIAVDGPPLKEPFEAYVDCWIGLMRPR